LGIEKEMGRTRTEKWAPRLIDLDILYFNSDVINEPELIIPHPHLHERRFVLEPLSEILPGKVHPVNGKKSIEMLCTLNDNLLVQRLNSAMPILNKTDIGGAN
jgi:7,8-dihydro-6-hydroxymethylpterin-pyrophosphokinase